MIAMKSLEPLHTRILRLSTTRFSLRDVVERPPLKNVSRNHIEALALAWDAVMRIMRCGKARCVGRGLYTVVKAVK